MFRRLANGLMTEREAFAPRQTYADGVYSSTTWPANQPMCMHHELSYTLEFPGLMLFACLTAPAEGGATAVADSPTVLDALPAELDRRGSSGDGWLLTRNYNEEIGASVRRGVRHRRPRRRRGYCRANAIDFEWQPDGGLRTRQRRNAVVRHPVTGQRCWFNQIAFLNEWTIAPEIREYLVDIYGEDGLPFNTRFGNGDPISEDIVAAAQRRLRRQHRPRAVAGRRPDAGRQHPYRAQQGAFEGPREVLVGMADGVQLADCSPTVEELTVR